MVVVKNRFLLMEIVWLGTPLSESSGILNHSTISSCIQESLQLNFGEHEVGCSVPALQVKYVNPITSVCLVRCSRDNYRKVWCAITYISSLRKHPVVFNLLDLSGNIKACKKVVLKYDMEKLKQLKLQLGVLLTPAQIELAQTTIARVQSLEG